MANRTLKEPHGAKPRPQQQQSPDVARVPFPHSQEDFEEDVRVSFSKVDQKWNLEDDDGSLWEFNENIEKWTPLLDETLLRQQQAAYAVPGMEEVRLPNNKKRKQEHQDVPKPQNERKNTAVYVTSIPLDATVSEIASVFSRYGVIAEGLEDNSPRINIYKDDNGKPKGDALVVYFRPESVQLAINMLDDSDFRYGVEGPNGKMRVKEAEASRKKQKEMPTEVNKKDKMRMKKRAEKLMSRLADWGDDDPSTLVESGSKFDKIVVLKHMFTLQELEEDENAKKEISEDIREEASKLGEVQNVVVYDLEQDGVATIAFATEEAAQACVKTMSGRSFGGEVVEAYIHNGTEHFRKNRASKNHETDEPVDTERLEGFTEYLQEKNGQAE
ncbi:hypothetical protein K402DRAFT_133513 [Aulographum hederae CBS 113979]|uniref:RRM domain-containing protein n=1 Tax=Aulographum hederae CBS 113979 TaxID=1176131 RepID=A0A6G1GVA5_9PEZI|nr:hypothetical protein K402DRAFT_133513 [Aulographum hederae CBS 113979]